MLLPLGSHPIGPKCTLKRLHRSYSGAGRGLVQANGSSNEGRESLLIDFIVLVEVDCAPGVAFEARVEESRRVLQRGPLEEREFHDALVRLAGADQTLMRPHRNPWIGSL